MAKKIKSALEGKKTLGIGGAQIVGTWAIFFLSNEMTWKLAVGYSLFAAAQCINRYFTSSELKLPFGKK